MHLKSFYRTFVPGMPFARAVHSYRVQRFTVAIPTEYRRDTDAGFCFSPAINL